MNFSIYVTGLMMGLSLIVAIGAQNAFILRQGLRNEYVFAVCLACALSDAALIVLGVTSLQQIAGLLPWLDPVMRYGGAAFLAWYGAKSLYSAFRSSAVLTAAEAETTSFSQTLATCLALTWLNPHVYLDTVVLLGTISTRYPGQQASFAAGAVSGSFLFFFSLGYGATWLRPVFSKASSWRMLETLVAFTMWVIAYKLVGRM
ncbi:LysE/ArgO family amino acid transporter [Rhizobium lentis]|uniref:LysE/ArgO family amino acid transporter n=1 Tax=Rhizobium lentis TaxID=1138194 RepID=UPI001C831410|nr:LysE/ArgO family amino acid transporter [Rhizobium lentis]MBX5045788.1 amino acid transporter [Rhizobium lentis]MBX5057800.1 amino acid transporter [Rhizobium lentis]